MSVCKASKTYLIYWNFLNYCIWKKQRGYVDLLWIGFFLFFSRCSSASFFWTVSRWMLFCQFNCYFFLSFFKVEWYCLLQFFGEILLSSFISFIWPTLCIACREDKKKFFLTGTDYVTDRGWVSSKWIDKPGHGLGGWIDFEFVLWISPEPGEVGVLETPIQSHPSEKPSRNVKGWLTYTSKYRKSGAWGD